MDKTKIYQRIKIFGFLSYIPFILALGPLSGFFLGNVLEKQFRLPSYITLISCALGFIWAIIEVIRIIKRVIKIDEKSKCKD
ncbi:MAG: hypothetical protein PHY94_06440 [Candidatus Omnitrophica bacterium]|nr:hypothetical protein [Candidatus Omnitrophota bacterium]